VRKQRTRPESRKVDVVITSARYQAPGDRLAQARGFERRGPVWSDTLLFDREALALSLRSGRRVVAGKETNLPGDFEIVHRLRLESDQWIVAEGGRADRDDLGVPLY